MSTTKREHKKRTENPTKEEETFSALRTLSAGVAHEIRNPLAVIQSLVELLAKNTRDEKQHELAESIVTEVKRLNRFLGEFLQYGRTPDLKYQPTSIKKLIKKVLCFAVPPEQNSKLTIHTDIPENLPLVSIDPDAFHQVLVNTILNAIQAIRGEGKIEIRARICKQKFILEIKDNGPGIPPETLDKIFSPFFTTKRSGSGLGLAISQQIIEQHSGQLYFKNNVDEQGVTLMVESPLSQGS